MIPRGVLAAAWWRRRLAGFSPTDIDGAVLWLRADLGVTLDGSGNVSAWADQSGNGNDVTQTSASSRPSYDDSVEALGGQPAIHKISGTSGTLESVSPASTFNFLHDGTGGTIAMVYEAVTPAANSQLYQTQSTISSSSVGSFSHTQTDDDNQWGIANGSAWAVLQTATLGAGGRYTTMRNGSGETPEWSFRADGSLDSSGSFAAAPSGADATLIFSIGVGSVSQEFRLAEIVAYNRYLTAPEVVRLESYIASHYAL